MRKAVLALLLFTACAGSVVRDFDFRAPVCEAATHNSALTVRYLGSGGIYINWKNDGLLIGPYFSHSGGPAQAVFGHAHVDQDRIKSGMRGVSSVRAMLFGHSHFDHIGDLPFIAQYLVESGPIYVNESGMKLLEASPDAHARAISVEGQQTIDVPDSSIRIHPIKWDHAPQLCRWRHLPCTYAFGEARPQRKEWKDVRLISMRGGQTYAYVIELMDGNDVAFRIFYNDAAGDERIAELPPAGNYDLAILCMASYDFVKGYPDALLERLKPHHVLVSHYEDFFKKQKQSSWKFVRFLTNAKAERFIERMEKQVAEPHGPINDKFCGVGTARWSMPVPGETLVFR